VDVWGGVVFLLFYLFLYLLITLWASYVNYHHWASLRTGESWLQNLGYILPKGALALLPLVILSFQIGQSFARNYLENKSRRIQRAAWTSLFQATAFLAWTSVWSWMIRANFGIPAPVYKTPGFIVIVVLLLFLALAIVNYSLAAFTLWRLTGRPNQALNPDPAATISQAPMLDSDSSSPTTVRPAAGPVSLVR
jgi:hypothetical protein